MVNVTKPLFNVYGDESCHLEHDGQRAMVLGALVVPQSQVKALSLELAALKKQFHLPRNYELKWTKVSPSKIDFYRQVLQWFFREPSLQFRGLIIPDKRKLNHGAFAQTHDQWYYKMYFETLKIIFRRDHQFTVYLDVKDTRGGEKLAQIRRICNQGSRSSSVQKVQLVRSEQTPLLQVADFLIGILSYSARNLTTSPAKLQLLLQTAGELGYPLTTSSPKKEKKFNFLIWEAS